MATAYSTLLGLALPVQGELSGTWGDMVDNGITRYVDIAVAGTVTLTNDGAVSLSLTNGDSSATNIVSSLTGAGTVSAQFAIIKVTGTLTTAKVLTPPSSSRTYVVVNAATGSTVTVKASGQTGVSIAVGETAFVYFNGTDYVKIVGTATAGAAGGSITQVQYNNAGVLAGITGATTNGTALTLVAPNLGSPASVGTMPAFTLGGTVSGGGNQINNVIIGTTTPLAGAFTTLTASSTLTVTGAGSIQGLTVGLGAGAVADNTAVGSSALRINSSGGQNTAIGYQAGYTNSTGSQLTAIGYQAGYFSNGGNNTFVGYYAGILTSSGSDNVALGSGALLSNSTASSNTAVGKGSLQNNTTASNNVAVGYQAGYTNQTGTLNTFVGLQAGYSNTANWNTFIGGVVGYSNTTGIANIAVGGPNAQNPTFYYNTTGSYNTALGSGALSANTSASFNTAVGFQTGYSTTTGAQNTAVGYQAGYSNTT